MSRLYAEVGFKPAYITFALQIKKTPHECGTFINYFSEMIVNEMQSGNCSLACELLASQSYPQIFFQTDQKLLIWCLFGLKSPKILELAQFSEWFLRERLECQGGTQAQWLGLVCLPIRVFVICTLSDPSPWNRLPWQTIYGANYRNGPDARHPPAM